MADTKERVKLPVQVIKPTPYNFDLGLLLANDPNPLEIGENLEESLAANARDGAQALLNQLLSTCPITATPAGVLLSLPAATTPLPREKPLPPPKAETTWQRFAKKKGIKDKTRESRQKMVYNEETGEWQPKWGYKGANKNGEQDWIVEVDVAKERERAIAGSEKEQRGDGRRERKDRIKRNDRLQRANDRKGRKGGAK